MDNSFTVKAVIATASGSKRVKRRSFDATKLSFSQLVSWLGTTDYGSVPSRILWRDEEDDAIDIVNNSDLRECIRSHTQRGISLLRLSVRFDSNLTGTDSITVSGPSTYQSIAETKSNSEDPVNRKCTETSLVVADTSQLCTQKSNTQTKTQNHGLTKNNEQKNLVHNHKTYIYRFKPGTAVRIHGLRVKTAYNDRDGVVVGTAKSGRVNVRVGTTICALRPDNILPLTRLNKSNTEFSSGASIVLHGLVSHPELNGVQGVVVRSAQHNDRTLVHVNGRTLAVKAKNLQNAKSRYSMKPQPQPYVLVPLRFFQNCCGA